jgi:hypothetical protein
MDEHTQRVNELGERVRRGELTHEQAVAALSGQPVQPQNGNEDVDPLIVDGRRIKAERMAEAELAESARFVLADRGIDPALIRSLDDADAIQLARGEDFESQWARDAADVEKNLAAMASKPSPEKEFRSPDRDKPWVGQADEGWDE